LTKNKGNENQKIGRLLRLLYFQNSLGDTSEEETPSLKAQGTKFDGDFRRTFPIRAKASKPSTAYGL
jgi:hypothetical protein